MIIQLPGDMTVFNIDWLSIFDIKTKTSYGSVIIPDGLNVPPSLVKVINLFFSSISCRLFKVELRTNANRSVKVQVIKRMQTLPNCIQLHKRFQVGWEIFGPQITVQLTGQIGK